MSTATEQPVIPERKRKLIDAAMRLIMKQGFSGTSVDMICAEAGVTKGSFFHYFSSKEELCAVAMEAWTCGWVQILAMAGFDEIPDPLDRLNRLFEIMPAAYLSAEVETGCLVGTVGQEIGLSNRRLGDLCEAHLHTWLEHTVALLKEAKVAHPPAIDFDPESLAMHMMSIVQGSMVVAKTMQDREIIVNSVRHSQAYVNLFFGRKP